jgi:16S rRNA (uracil1498-N3)-methyltransferase
MTRRRWIADQCAGDQAALIGSHADHLIRVLRAQVGQEFDISTGEGVRRGRIVNIADGRVVFALGEKLEVTPSANLTLVLSIFRFDRMEWAIEKCTELGATKIDSRNCPTYRETFGFGGGKARGAAGSELRGRHPSSRDVRRLRK